MNDVQVIVVPPVPVQVEVTEPLHVAVTVTPTIVYTGDMNLISPVFVGVPEAPTAAPGTATAQLATTEFVDKATRYVHTQLAPVTVWAITHNMKKYPSVTVIDDAGEQMIGEVVYTSLDVVTITFSAAISGKAYLT